MLICKYLQLISTIRETRRKFENKEISQSEALQIFDGLMDEYLELKNVNGLVELQKEIQLLIN